MLSGPLDWMLPNLKAYINRTGSIAYSICWPWPNFQGHSFMTEIATIDWFGKWGTSVFSENTAIFCCWFYAHNFKEVEGHIGLGLSVGPSICASVTLAYGQEWLETGSWNLISGITMKYKWTHIFFFSVRLVVAELCPCFWHSHCKPLELCEQNISRTTWARISSWYLAHRLCQ